MLKGIMKTIIKAIIILISVVFSNCNCMAQKNENDLSLPISPYAQEVIDFLEGKQSEGYQRVTQVEVNSKRFPFWVDELRLYLVHYGLNKDPTPSPQRFIVTPDNSVFSDYEMGKALKHIGFSVNSKTEALEIACLLVHSINSYEFALQDKATIAGVEKNHIRNKVLVDKIPKKISNKINEPVINKRDNHFIVKIYVHNYAVPKARLLNPENSLSLKKIIIGNGTYSIDSEELIWDANACE